MSNNKRRPTEAELEVLQILWNHGPSSVRFVNDKLAEDKKVGYTTTLKIMQIMTDKGLTLRDTSARSHIYRSAVSENLAKENLLTKFINATFQGSASQLVLHLLDHNNTSQSELEEIKNIINNFESE
jgi:predicted transcriptional regulator